MKYVFGLDLGQRQDYTAGAILELAGSHEAPHLVRHLQRWPLGTPYPKIVADVKQMISEKPLQDQCRLVADATGVGLPVVELFNLQGIYPAAVLITAGELETFDGGFYKVPKRVLVAVLQVLLQQNWLKVAEGLPEARVLVNELLNFKVKITAAANDTYGAWREGDHDDLVLAVALACWQAQKYAPRFTDRLTAGSDVDDRPKTREGQGFGIYDASQNRPTLEASGRNELSPRRPSRWTRLQRGYKR